MTVLEKFQLTGKVAVVTGGFGKLGPVWIKTLLAAGGSVVVLDLPNTKMPEDLQALQTSLGEDRLIALPGDVTSRASLEEANRTIEQTVGPVDILVNNAGIDQPPGQLSASYELFDIPMEQVGRVLEVNTVGAFQCMQVFGRSMVQRHSGSIINIGSLYASVSPDARFYDHIDVEPPFLKPPGYGASKAALLNLTKYFATHWGPYNVRVNGLSPGGVEGGQDPQFKAKFCHRVPLGRMAALDDLVGPLLFLASDAASYVTGIELKVDGGFTAW
jgi:NAD(P)-dependent dehydrogenase (short-subunit alcohol dehydrogenase family)